VLRYDGAHVPAPAATVDQAGTWLLRITLFMGSALLLAVAYRRRWPSPAYESKRTLTEINRKPA